MPESLSESLAVLAAGKERLAKTGLRGRTDLLEACLDGIVGAASDWVDCACEIKGIPPNSTSRAEEVTTGPVAAARLLRLLLNTFDQIQKAGKPRLPGPIEVEPDGTLRVPVLPEKALFDPILFAGFKAYVRMNSEVNRENFDLHLAPQYRGIIDQPPRVSLVLGAGNVSSIPVTDTLSKIFLDNSVVLLKMNPVNEGLGPVFERAFKPLVDAGLLRVIYGGREVGEAAVNAQEVEDIHITGAIETHDSIVWGPAGSERTRRKAENDPLHTKPITSELGNVTPWIMVPGPYSEKELAAQVETIAGSICSNASFNCIATKVIVTWNKWPQRQKFIDSLQTLLGKIPMRKAYYPGAIERFTQFTGMCPSSVKEGKLPWTLIPNLNRHSAEDFLKEEWFVCLTAEICLDAESESDFLRKAVDFVNEELWGTLAAQVTVHPSFHRDPSRKAIFWDCISHLRYGVVAINQWSGLAYALMSLPWGGYPGQPLSNVQSGTGWVHNSLMLDSIEKGILMGPLRIIPRPIWLPTHPNPEPIAWRLYDLFDRPGYGALLKILLASLSQGRLANSNRAGRSVPPSGTS